MDRYFGAIGKTLPGRNFTTYISDYIFPGLLQGMEGVLAANGSAPLLYATQNQVATERRILQTLLIRKDLDGILPLAISWRRVSATRLYLGAIGPSSSGKGFWGAGRDEIYLSCSMTTAPRRDLFANFIFFTLSFFSAIWKHTGHRPCPLRRETAVV